MSGRRDESLLLDDMIGACERIIDLVASAPRERLGEDRAIAEGIQFNLIVLGEAAKRLPKAVCERYPDVPWSDVAETRDRIVHHYEGVDWGIVGLIADDELPKLLPRLAEIRDLLSAEFDEGSSPASRP
jgi:uncharacterized protein with HEPN domain